MQLPVLFNRPDISSLGKFAATKSGLLAGQLELTSDCGQRCAMCESWRDHQSGTHRHEWALADAVELLHELDRIDTFEHLSFTGGDPQWWSPLQTLVEESRFRFALQLNTALLRPVAEWYTRFRDVRVSLDGVTRGTYAAMRGDKNTDPEDILDRMRLLTENGVRVSTNTCVTTTNIHEVPAILHRLREDVPDLRKASFLIVIGNRDRKKNLIEGPFFEQWQRVRDAALAASWPFAVSFSEDPASVRAELLTEAAAAVPCYAGNISFHIKANGDYYPCCLTGGEAIGTHERYRIGNVRTDGVLGCWERYQPVRDYADAGAPCRDICQWKQAAVNFAAHLASASHLSMP